MEWWEINRYNIEQHIYKPSTLWRNKSNITHIIKFMRGESLWFASKAGKPIADVPALLAVRLT